MRINVVVLSLICGICLLCIPVMIVSALFSPVIHFHELDWTGMAAYIGAIGVACTGILATKAHQKKYENGSYQPPVYTPHQRPSTHQNEVLE